MVKFRSIIPMVLLVIIISLSPAAAADDTTSATEAKELTLAPKEGFEGEWELRGPDGELMAAIKSKEERSFKIYKPNGSYMGYVYESLNWVPKDARQKRELQIPIEDVRLFLDILKAEGTFEPVIGDFELKPDQKVKEQWEVQEPGGAVVGTVQKSEQRYKFYNGEKFMGYIDTSGTWIPKLGINRREMRITPDQATFCLNVFYAIKDM